jgi:ribosomal protein S18 acetylase RimI-like enzyme
MLEAPTIRLARPDDHPAICAIVETADELHRDALPWLFRRPEGPPRPVEDFADFFRGEKCAALVADVGRVVGVAFVLLRSAPAVPLFHQQSYAVLDNIAVDPEFRRRGIGTKLTAGAVGWARARGAAWLELGVYEFNRDAIAFYDALGFQILSHKLRMPLGGKADS